MNLKTKIMKRKIRLLYVGSMITLRAIQHYLDEQQIDNMIKDVVESGRLAGFGTSISSDEIYVFEQDFKKAREVLDVFLNKNEN